MNKTSWKVDLVHMDIEVIAILLNSFLVVGINIPTFSPPFLKSRFPGEIRPPVVVLPHCSTVPKTLRPSTGTDDDDDDDDDGGTDDGTEEDEDVDDGTDKDDEDDVKHGYSITFLLLSTVCHVVI
jgi:hypothetical protein